MKKSLLSVMLFASLYAGAQTFTFTTAGVSGQNGPTQVDVNAAYTGTPLDGNVTITTQGIQEWTVPTTGNYSIQAIGASGGNSTWSGTVLGGNGADMTGEFTLTAGQVISVMVGQMGETDAVGGGGGGTFVATAGTPLIVAGGGGGASSDQPGQGAVTTTDGTADTQSTSLGGTNGNGGSACMNVNGNNGGAGGGFNTNGASPNSGGGSENNGYGGLSFLNGGIGGEPGRDDGACTFDAYGGFGGGGSTTCNTVGGGGGGGYSGGAGGAHVGQCGASLRAGGGGGGSYNSGTNPTNVAASNVGDGLVIITKLCTDLTITPVADTMCRLAGLTLTATSANGGNITWDNGATNGVEFFPDTTGWVTYTATSDNGGDCGISVMVYFNDIPSVTLTSTDEIMGNDGTITLTINSAVPPVTFDWDNDGTGDFDDTQDLSGLAGGMYTVEVMDSNGCSVVESILVGSQVSLAEIQLNAMKLYPNPSVDGKFTISEVGIIESLEVFDAQGRKVNVNYNTKTGEVDGSQLTNGKYLVHVESSKGSFVTAIVISK